MDVDHLANFEIFLSHSSLDYEKVRKIRNAFEEAGCKPIMFHLKCLERSDDEEVFGLLKREIDAREWFVLCKSKNADSSKWVRQEMNYVRQRKAPYVAQIDADEFEPSAFVDTCCRDWDEDSWVTLLYPKLLQHGIDYVAGSLRTGYHVALVKYDDDFEEAYSRAQSMRGRLLLFMEERQRMTLRPFLVTADRLRTCAFVLRNDWAESKKVLLNDGVYMLPEEFGRAGLEKESVDIISLAIHSQQLLMKAKAMPDVSAQYKEKCRLLSECGYACQCAGYYGKAFACYLKARNIASFNNDPDLSGFYFEAREDPIHEALVGHVPIRDLIWPDNIAV